jgi:purine-nucleoside phosphorylase
MVIWAITSLLAACTGAPADKIETVSHLVEKVDVLTQDAIQQRDIERIRDLWSQISELGVSLEDHGYYDEAEAVEQLAATYMYLIDYMQTGKSESLIQFETGYSAALYALKNVADELGSRT